MSASRDLRILRVYDEFSDYVSAQSAEEHKTLFVDLFDVMAWGADRIGDHLAAYAPMLERLSTGLGHTICGLLLAACTVLLGGALRWKRPFTCGAPCFLRVLLAATVIQHGRATPGERPSRLCASEPWRRPTDIELWAAGQRTVREQLADALAQHTGRIFESGGRLPPAVYPDGPPLVEPRPPDPPARDEDEEWQGVVNIEGEELTTHHISFWITSVGMQPETLDVGLMFPLTDAKVHDIIEEAVKGLDTGWLTDPIEVTPQPNADYGSYILVPEWLRHSSTRVVLVDARSYDLGVFPVYVDAPVSRLYIFGVVGLAFTTEADVYVGGSDRPLAQAERYLPENGCYVQVRRRGDPPAWFGPVSARFADPALWRPETDHPLPARGRYIQFHTELERHDHWMRRTDLRTPQQVAAEAFDFEAEQFWLRAPTERPTRMQSGNLRVYSVIAVLDYDRYDKDDVHVVFLDMRPIGRWIAWVATRRGDFHPGNYIQELQLRAVPGFSVVVQGGRRSGRKGHLHVADGEVLTVVLRPTASLAAEGPSSPPASDGSDEDDDEGDSDGSDRHGNIHSSDLSGTSASPPQPGDPPRGPPPPEPVHRSRSPRRRDDIPTAVLAPLRLQDALPPPAFDLDLQQVPLPHTPAAVHYLLAPWAPDWMSFTLPRLLKPATVGVLRHMRHWSDVLFRAATSAPPEVHIYVDGSWHEGLQLGGYAVAVLLVTAGSASLFGLLGEQLQGNPQTPWQFDAAPALKTEQAALMTALLWCLQSRSFLMPAAYRIFYDCAVAGGAATGAWDCDQGIGLQTRAVAQLLQDIAPVPVTIQHIKAHAGDPINELVDTLAKEMAQGTAVLPVPPAQACRLVQQVDLTWLPLVVQNLTNDAYPVAAGRQLQWNEAVQFKASELQPSQLIPTVSEDGGTRDIDPEAFTTTVLTLNAQTMSGRHKYYEEQLLGLGVQIACFQETRGRAGLTESKAFLRLSTDSQSHWGVSIWLNKIQGFVERGGRPVIAQEDDLKIVIDQPRLLVIAIDVGGARVVVYSAHCPDSSKGDAATGFLATLAQALRPYHRSCLVLGGIDLNGRVPTGCPGHTGELMFGQADANGEDMLRLAKDLGFWFPSTYEQLHVGPSTTFHHAQGSAHRIDYVLVGGPATIWSTRSHVEDSFDTLNLNDDHKPAVVALQGAFGAPGVRKRLWRPRFDTEKMLTPEGRATIAAALSSFRSPSWDCHPDQHCQQLQDFLLGIMQTHFSCKDNGPRAVYIPDEVWALRCAKLALKNRTRHRTGLWKDLVGRAFCQWRDSEDFAVAPLVAKQGVLYEIAAAAINFATGRIKLGLRASKKDFLSRIANGGVAKAAEILSVAKRAGVGGRQARPFHRPLPALLMPGGSLCATRADRDATWLEQFSKQEFGRIVPTADYLSLQDKPVVIDESLDWTLADVPAYFEVEQAFRHAPTRKSCGLDCLPGELLKADPAGMTKAAYPLFLKAALSLRQPVQWRGGVLREAWKRKGPVQDPTSYRSLFISSTMGKTFHKVLRSRATQYAGDMLLGFQMGARKQAPVTLPGLFIQAHLRRGCRDNVSTAVLFLDVQSAYYTVIREMSVGLIESDESVAKVFHYFGLEPEDLLEFWGDIRQGGIMGQSAMPAPLRHMAKDIMHQSWFVTGYGTSARLCVTQAGSRPGEAWADLVFAYVLGKILCRIREAAAGEGLLQSLPADIASGPYAAQGDGLEVPALECAWADDAAFPTADPRPERLLEKAARLSSIVLHECARHGLQPNLRPGKTALLLAVRGTGSRKARARWFHHGRSVITLPDLAVELPVVGAYTHLGGVVDAAMTPSRCSPARASFRPPFWRRSSTWAYGCRLDSHGST